MHCIQTPAAPGGVSVKILSKESIRINWQEPVTDGGSPILGYHVECRKRDSSSWERINRIIIKTLEYKASGLKEGVEYEIRVMAENLAGCGKPSRMVDGIVTRDPVDPPTNIDIIDIR